MILLAGSVRHGSDPNGLGEVQGEGHTVDRLCALVVTYADAIHSVAALLEGDEQTAYLEAVFGA